MRRYHSGREAVVRKIKSDVVGQLMDLMLQLEKLERNEEGRSEDLPKTS